VGGNGRGFLSGKKRFPQFPKVHRGRRIQYEKDNSPISSGNLGKKQKKKRERERERERES
jgi:hypothetical protein